MDENLVEIVGFPFPPLSLKGLYIACGQQIVEAIKIESERICEYREVKECMSFQ